jgi:uncharacterized protein YndB with AHSA1/START domain
MKVEKQGDTVVATLEIAAAPEAVFEALTDPSQLVAWWGTPGDYRTENWQVDARAGGKWSCDVRGPQDSTPKTIHGVYEEFDPPRVLAFTWNPEWQQIPETRVRITLEPTATGTLLRLVHSGFGDRREAQERHYQGWTRVLGWLDGFCRAKVSGK